MKSVSNALRILLLLSDRGSVRLTEAGELLGISTSALHRLLTTLKAYSFVDQDRPHGPYTLGIALPQILERRHPEQLLLSAARSELQRLQRATNETANLFSLRGSDAVFIDGVEGTQALRVATRIGDRVPAYATASGKVMLAELNFEEVWDLFPHRLGAMTEHTISTVLDLTEELRQIRSRGYALNVNETLDGVVAVGVPIRQTVSPVQAAVTVSLPFQRYESERLDLIITELQASAETISEEMNRLSGLRYIAVE